MKIKILRFTCRAILLALVAFMGHLRAESAAPSRPAVLFTGASLGTIAPNYEFARWLNRDGFAVGALPSPGLDEKSLTWEEVRPYNVIVLSGLGLANGDDSLTSENQQTIETLNRFLKEGGSIIYFPLWWEQNNQIPPQNAFFKPLGLTPFFDQVVFDPANAVTATPWKIDLAHTTDITPSPITEGITSLWYPTATRTGDVAHVVPFLTDPSWHVVVTGSKTSYSRTVPLDRASVGKEGDPGKFSSHVPLVAYREVGKGRIVVFGINATWLYGANAQTTLEGTVSDKGLNGIPSQGYQLFVDALRWLAEPSFPTGSSAADKAANPSSSPTTTLGGAESDPALTENPYLTKFCEPLDWTKQIQNPFPSIPHALPGVIGARTALSGGKGTVEEWVREAKAQGLSYIVFLEDFAGLSPDKFATLKSECARLTDANFAAIPGFHIQDEVGNYYFYCGDNVFYPPKYLLSDDGKVFVSYDPGLAPDNPRKLKGQLASTVIQYTYQLGGFKFTAGNYLFHSGASPFGNFFSVFTSVGVITRKDGHMIEDATPEFLQMIGAGQGPLPMTIDFMNDPAELKQTPWRTVLRLAAGTPEGKNPIGSFFDEWNFYPNNPASIYITSGPQIEYWSNQGYADYVGNNRGDFVWQNDRWRVGGKVSAVAGLKEVAVYDGSKLFRRFLPQGRKQFEFALDLTHNQQHNLVLIATDLNGNRAISGEQWDRNHRLEETNCTDRDNQLGYGYLTRRDGTYLQLAGNPAVTPQKRVPNQNLDPASAFYNDPLLGAPAFDGLAGGAPSVDAPATLRLQSGGEIPSPKVADARRLLHTGDTHIGAAYCEFNFADGVPVSNVWNSLWRTVPASDFTLERRNQMFQVDPDSPLAVYIMKLRVTMKRDIPNNGFLMFSLEKGDCTRWIVRGSDGKEFNGDMVSAGKVTLNGGPLPFASGGYTAMLDSPLGSTAMFSLSDGLEVSWQSPAMSSFNVVLPAAAAPQKRGESREVELLLVGIPRLTHYTEALAKNSAATVQRFARDFGLGTDKPAYVVTLQSGKITDQRYVLRVDGHTDDAFSGVLSGDLISTLPIAVGGLNDHWTAMLYDRNEKKARPLGVFEKTAWATVRLHGKDDLFVGHPVTCDNPNIFLQLTQTGDDSWSLEAHNPTDQPLTVNLSANSFFDPLKNKQIADKPVEIPAGQSIYLTF